MANAAEENLDLDILFGWITPRDRGGGQRRLRTGSGIGFGFEHILNLDARRVSRYAKYAIVHAKYANLCHYGMSEGAHCTTDPPIISK